MYETTITYDNADGRFCFDDEIRATMNWWHGEETDSGQDLETLARKITFAFGDESNAIKASRALEGLLGNYFEPVKRITLTDKPEEPKTTNSVIDPDQSQLPQESASVLGSNRCAGLKHRNDIGATGPDAKAIFDSFAERLGWDFGVKADVLLNYCGEDMIEPLLRHIQEDGQTEDLADFLIDNFGDDQPDRKKNGIRLSPTQTAGG